MREGVKLAVVLLIICAVSSGLLGLTNDFTQPQILARRAQSEAEAKAVVMPQADDISQSVDEETFNAVLDELMLTSETLNQAYIAKQQDAVIGYVFECTVKGFGGDIKVMVGVNIEGTVSGVKVTSHSETVGLGSKATDEEWVSQFNGLSAASDVQVVKTENRGDNEITAITGATITSRAVVSAVNYALQAFTIINGGL